MLIYLSKTINMKSTSNIVLHDIILKKALQVSKKMELSSPNNPEFPVADPQVSQLGNMMCFITP